MTIKFSSFPSDVQTEVTLALRQDRRAAANHRMRYYKNHGYSDAMEYHKEVMITFKPSHEHVKETIVEVMVRRYKVNGYKLEDWMQQIPNARHICSTAFTPKHC